MKGEALRYLWQYEKYKTTLYYILTFWMHSRWPVSLTAKILHHLISSQYPKDFSRLHFLYFQHHSSNPLDYGVLHNA